MATATTGDRPCTKDALPALRRWTVEQLSRRLPSAASETIEDARLIVSELVTNGVRAGCTRLCVSLTLRPRGILIEVAEDAPGRPQPIRCGPSADHGRGLTLVEVLTRGWGVRETPAGKTVWAELPLDLGRADVAVATETRPSGVPTPAR